MIMKEKPKENRLYSKVIKVRNKNEYNQEIMKLMRDLIVVGNNKKKIMDLTVLIKDNKAKGKPMYYTGINLGMYGISHNGKNYSISPFLCIEHSNTGEIKVVYMIKDGYDTIKLAKKKLDYIGLTPKVSEVIETMSLQGKL